MPSLFRRPPDDLGPLRDAVESLGTSSVPGLAAALSWRERRTEKALIDELSRPGSPVTYDPALRVVRWAPPIVEEPPADGPDLPAAEGPAGVPRPSTALAPTGAKPVCPSCHVPLLAAATGSIVVCPNCGRLTTVRARAAGTAGEGSAEAPSAPARGTSPIADRRSQELFAAYVTAKPIPCPRCRTPLRHKGISEYACPACGETVRFASAPPPAPVAPAEPKTTAASDGPLPGPRGTGEERAPAASASTAAPVPIDVPAEQNPEPGPAVGAPATSPLRSSEAAPTPLPASERPAVSAVSRTRVDLPRAYPPPPTPAAPSRAPGPKKYRLPRVRATCRVPPRFAP